MCVSWRTAIDLRSLLRTATRRKASRCGHLAARRCHGRERSGLDHVFLCGALIGLACSGSPVWAGEPASVLFVTVDTLRADRMASYGYERSTSPNIDELVQRGTYFRRAYAQAPWTRPSVARWR